MGDFIAALKQRDLEEIKLCPKSDLHNHFVLGGIRLILDKHLKEQKCERS